LNAEKILRKISKFGCEKVIVQYYVPKNKHICKKQYMSDNCKNIIYSYYFIAKISLKKIAKIIRPTITI